MCANFVFTPTNFTFMCKSTTTRCLRSILILKLNPLTDHENQKTEHKQLSQQHVRRCGRDAPEKFTRSLLYNSALMAATALHHTQRHLHPFFSQSPHLDDSPPSCRHCSHSDHELLSSWESSSSSSWDSVQAIGIKTATNSSSCPQDPQRQMISGDQTPTSKFISMNTFCHFSYQLSAVIRFSVVLHWVCPTHILGSVKSHRLTLVRHNFKRCFYRSTSSFITSDQLVCQWNPITFGSWE